MDIKDVITLINTVSESKLTSFSYKEGETKLSFEVSREQETTGTSVVMSEVVTASSQELVVEKPKTGKLIKSPMVGTFYNAKGEGEKPYISVGETIRKGQIIGIVEAMKLMNEIESPYDGIVDEILITNQEMVGFDQLLVRVK